MCRSLFGSNYFAFDTQALVKILLSSSNRTFFLLLLPRSYSLVTPNFILIFGDIIDELNGDDIMEPVRYLVIVFGITGAVAFVGGTVMVRHRKAEDGV